MAILDGRSGQVQYNDSQNQRILTTQSRENSCRMLHPALRGNSHKDQSMVSPLISFKRPGPSSNKRDGL